MPAAAPFQPVKSETDKTHTGGGIRPFIQPFIRSITHRHKLGGGANKKAYPHTIIHPRLKKHTVIQIIRTGHHTGFYTGRVILLVVVSRCNSGGCEILVSMWFVV
jgi:hypothetical protein